MNGLSGSGRISLHAEAASAILRPMDLKPYGAQVFCIDLRLSDDTASIVVTLKTATGGEFAFGGGSAVNRLKADGGRTPDATYQWTLGPADAEGWRRIIVRVFDLRWSDSTHDPAVLPNHEITELCLHVLEPRVPNANIEFGRLCFGRPRTTLPRHEPHKIVLAGRASPETEISIASLLDPLGAIATVVSDCRGGFISDPLARGAYRVVNTKNQTASTVDAERDYFNIDLRG
jgi:hypothetical protein